MPVKMQWRVARKSDYQPERVERTVAAIPSQVQSILEVGCNRGQVANELHCHGVRVFGLDIDGEALRHASCPKVHADGRALPAKDRSVDMVLLAECLEHLDGGGLSRASQEAERVAGRYILVSVPWKQNLAQGLMLCRCGDTFHSYGHIQRFDAPRLQHLFREFTMVQSVFVGARRPSVVAVSRLRHLGGRYASWEGAVCPKCGNTDFPHVPRNRWTVVAGLMELAVSAFPVSVPIWVLALYRRRDLLTRDIGQTVSADNGS